MLWPCRICSIKSLSIRVDITLTFNMYTFFSVYRDPMSVCAVAFLVLLLVLVSCVLLTVTSKINRLYCDFHVRL